MPRLQIDHWCKHRKCPTEFREFEISIDDNIHRIFLSDISLRQRYPLYSRGFIQLLPYNSSIRLSHKFIRKPPKWVANSKRRKTNPRSQESSKSPRASASILSETPSSPQIGMFFPLLPHSLSPPNPFIRTAISNLFAKAQFQFSQLSSDE
jgi:hypothetical protein